MVTTCAVVYLQMQMNRKCDVSLKGEVTSPHPGSSTVMADNLTEDAEKRINGVVSGK